MSVVCLELPQNTLWSYLCKRLMARSRCFLPTRAPSRILRWFSTHSSTRSDHFRNSDILLHLRDSSTFKNVYGPLSNWIGLIVLENIVLRVLATPVDEMIFSLRESN